MANQSASLDDNQYPALTAHSGTSDTAETRKITTESVGGSVGLHSWLLGGTVTTNAGGGGTVVEVALLPDLPGGTIDNIGSVANIGVIHNAGTIAALPQVSVGTLPVVVLPDPVGSFVMTGGTLLAVPQISVGTLPTVTLDNYGTNVNVVTGTQQTLGTVGTVIGIGTLTNIGNLTSFAAGTANTLGTVGVVDNIVAGTLSSVKINHIPVGSAVISTHVLGTGGGTFVGTLVAPTGAGTSLYLSGLSIVVHSGTVDCGIANNVAGTTGAGVYARGSFIPSAGIARDYTVAKNLGTNGTVAYFMISPGTASFMVDWWVTP